MLKDDHIRNLVFDRLTKAGWMTGSITKDISPNGIRCRVAWTPDGLEKMRTLHRLIQTELGFGKSYRGGELECLRSLIDICIMQEGPGDASDEHPRSQA